MWKINNWDHNLCAKREEFKFNHDVSSLRRESWWIPRRSRLFKSMPLWLDVKMCRHSSGLAISNNDLSRGSWQLRNPWFGYMQRYSFCLKPILVPRLIMYCGTWSRFRCHGRIFRKSSTFIEGKERSVASWCSVAKGRKWKNIVVRAWLCVRSLEFKSLLVSIKKLFYFAVWKQKRNKSI